MKQCGRKLSCCVFRVQPLLRAPRFVIIATFNFPSSTENLFPLDINNNKAKIVPRDQKKKNTVTKYITLRQNKYHSGRALPGHEGLISSVSSGKEMTVAVADK